MQLGFHFGFKKSKAYGLCGVMLAILFLGMSGQSAKADEMLSPTDTSSTLKESTDNHEASYSEAVSYTHLDVYKRQCYCK